MSVLTISIPGVRTDNAPADTTEYLAIEKTYVIGSATRGEAVTSHVEELDGSKIIEFVYDDDTVWVGDFTTIDEIFPGTSKQLRSTENGDGVFVIPTEVQVGDASRGIFQKIALKIVKIFTKKVVLAPLVHKLAGELEDKQLGEQRGLLGFTDAFTLVKKELKEDTHYLLFIHGTATSTIGLKEKARGSFDDLKGTDVWSAATRAFPQNILAFQHETLTKSPLENALDLIRQLPAKVTLTLVTQSRGGLVGDILNRFCPGGSALQVGFSANEKNFLRKQKRDKDLELIEEIEIAMRDKSITINKFIRVACPASGTTLASRRLDTYFNVIFNVIGLASGLAATPVYIAFKDLLAALIESKDDASALPGLEVQNPKSAFNQMLNNIQPETIISTPLIIISGDGKMSLRWQGLKVALSNLFFWGDNDFIVDSRSMYNGAKRENGKVQYFFDESSDVSHFKYFENTKTRKALQLALEHKGDTLIPSFSKLDTRAFTEAEIRNIDSILPGGKVFRTEVSGKKPIVVLLPGIMGSTLSVNDKAVWINLLGFAFGGLTRLVHSEANNKNVKADGLVGSSYKKLTDHLLKNNYDVVTFPFDWRTDMKSNATVLNRKIIELQQHRQPIKLIGHSMGGVLIRDFIINHSDTWKELNSSNDFRLLFLGAPLGGSFRIPYVLFGLDSLIRKLDFIDVTNSQKELLVLFSQFPGILSLLPLTTDTDNDFAKPAVWEKMRDAFGEPDWPIPANALLEDFADYRNNSLQKMGNIDFGRTVYIAGQTPKGEQTISGYRIVDKGKGPELEFRATQEGDGSVTWESGIPQVMIAQKSVYYSDVSHGELANDSKLFGAITDILSTGLTTQLKRTPPALRGLGTDHEFEAKASFDFDLSPEGVERTLLGLGTDTRFTTGDTPITVTVSNGDLKYASFPLLAGHFDKDGILSAEKAINWHLDGELSRRHQLGLYPGPIGTGEIILRDTDKGFQGAIIVGLGKQGLLTEYWLTSTVEQGTVKYLANLNSNPDKINDKNSIPKRGISALIIGSGYGGLRIENAVRSIIQGVQNANNKVRQLYASPKLIDTIEFVELYKDRSLACMKAISAIEKEESRALNIFRNGNKIKQLIGWRERLPMDDTTEWWTRISVHRYSEDELPSEAQRRALRFAISTDAARMEERLLKTVNETLLGMLEELSRKDAWSPELAKTIFELMIPNDFKEQLKRQNNIIWILDKYTAAFPWELLQDSITNARPLSVNAGMVRQLLTGNFRINVNPVVEQTAIVIGDPQLNGFARQLPAAFTEGESVADLLLTQGFEVNRLLKETAAQILHNLFGKNYKIVHLAGHGVFNSDPNKPAGMLIGQNAFLTPAYIDQMSNVPELVFVNCCFLGQSDGDAEEFNRSRFQLAANIGTQLIEIGVKAVIVAGWAVNDSAALLFAEQFYKAMFEGYTFGEAVKKARKAVYENDGAKTNTWGAYHAYGDPFYKLSNEAVKADIVYDFVIPEEAEIELGNLLNKIERGGYDSEETIQTMDAIEQALTKSGIKSGRITELQALLYSALNEYELAVAKFEELWKVEKASFSFSATEKYCNTKVKLYVAQVKKKGAANPQVIGEAIDGLKGVIADLEGLSRFGATMERTNLLASTYKRLAMLSSGPDKRSAYECSASYYRKAYENPDNKNKYYPLTNWVAIENALVLEGSHSWGKNHLLKKGDFLKALDAELELLQSKAADDRDYWDWIAEPTLLLCKFLLETPKVTFESVLEKYTSVWKMVGTQGQRQAEIEHLEFLEDALGMGNSQKKIQLLEEVSRLKMVMVG
ncbi:CHAT domain-containing protein [Runella sp.]|uniref:CHAT domain-containing protein n=1 Tax=Runella sp. TaxID=1960881 RepID=UPI003D0FDA07